MVAWYMDKGGAAQQWKKKKLWNDSGMLVIFVANKTVIAISLLRLSQQWPETRWFKKNKSTVFSFGKLPVTRGL